MPFVRIPNTYRIELRYQWDAQNVLNVFHVGSSSVPSLLELQEILSIFSEFWNDTLRNYQVSTVVFQEVFGRDMDAEFSFENANADYAGIQGNDSGSSPANNVTIAFSWRTGMAGRSRRGRTYHVGMSENHITGSFVNTGFLDDLTTAYLSLWNTLQTNSTPLVVASFQENGVTLDPAHVHLITNGYFVDNVSDSQRRRLPGRGR